MSCPAGYETLPMARSVGGSNFIAVGTSRSLLGRLELIWKPGATRKSNSTWDDLPRERFRVGIVATCTEGVYGLGGPKALRSSPFSPSSPLRAEAARQNASS